MSVTKTKGPFTQHHEREPPKWYSVANKTGNGADHRYDADTWLGFAANRTRAHIADNIARLVEPDTEDALGFIAAPVQLAASPLAFLWYAATARAYLSEPVKVTADYRDSSGDYVIERSDGSITKIVTFGALPERR